MSEVRFSLDGRNAIPHGLPVDPARVTIAIVAGLSSGHYIVSTYANAYGAPCSPLHASRVRTFVGLHETSTAAHEWARATFPTATITVHS